MKKDPSGNQYYFNRDTSVSTFDVPEGFLSKEEYKALKKQVEEIRSNDPAGTMFQCERMRFQKFGTEF